MSQSTKNLQVPTTSAILPTIIGLAAAKTAAIGTVALLGLKAKFLGAKVREICL